jgi:hypothetical protein
MFLSLVERSQGRVTLCACRPPSVTSCHSSVWDKAERLIVETTQMKPRTVCGSIQAERADPLSTEGDWGHVETGITLFAP